MVSNIVVYLKLSSLWLTPDEKYLDSASLGSDVLDGVFRKPDPRPNFDCRKIALYDDNLQDIHKTITGIPATSIKFDEWDIAPFREHSALKTPKFKDKDLELLWKWSPGATAKELGLFHMQVNRLVRKFVKETLEMKHNA